MGCSFETRCRWLANKWEKDVQKVKEAEEKVSDLKVQFKNEGEAHKNIEFVTSQLFWKPIYIYISTRSVQSLNLEFCKHR